VNKLVWSNLAAQLAEQISLAAIPLVAVLAFGAGAGETGLLQTAQTLPFLLLALPAGLLADRLSRTRLMVCGEVLRAASLASVVLLIYSAQLTLPLLGVLGMLGACGTVLYSVVAPALVPAYVAPGRLALANSRLELARTVAFALGPVLAGALVGIEAFCAAAALSGVAAVLLSRLPEPARPKAARRRIGDELAEGARFVFGHPLLRPVFITQVVFSIAIFAIHAVFVPYAVQSLGLSAAEVGWVLGCYGAGMVVGAVAAPRVARALKFGEMVMVGPVCGLAASLLLVVTLWAPSGALAAAAFFLFGAGPILWVISTTTLRQTVTPAALLGRVSAINSMAYGARPIGAALGTALAATWAPSVALMVAAAGFLIQLCVIAASPAARLVRQPA
jgi:predicted MFS family arabinose efflux permease